MKKYQNDLDSKFTEGIFWEELEGKKASRIKFEMPTYLDKELGKFKDKTSWDKRIEWFRISFDSFHKAINPIWEKIQRDIN